MSGDDSTAKGSALLKSLVYLIVVATSLFVALPLALWSFTREFLTFRFGAYRFLGFIPLALGAAFTLWATVYLPLFGKGTPAHSDPPKKLVTTGPFKYTRNPMYLGAILTLIGQAVILESPIIFLLAVLMWLLFYLLVAYYEEPDLRKRFGQAYEEYSMTVPRWLPGILRKHKQDAT